jgi:hypothetical protein
MSGWNKPVKYSFAHRRRSQRSNGKYTSQGLGCFNILHKSSRTKLHRTSEAQKRDANDATPQQPSRGCRVRAIRNAVCQAEGSSNRHERVVSHRIDGQSNHCRGTKPPRRSMKIESAFGAGLSAPLKESKFGL